MQGLLVTKGPGDVQTLAAAKGHAWTHISTTVGICLEIQGLCCYRRTYGDQGVGLQSVILLESEGCAGTVMGLGYCCGPYWNLWTCYSWGCVNIYGLSYHRGS